MALDVPAGQHRIGCGDSDIAYAVDVEPGRAALVEIVMRIGWMAPGCTAQPLDERRRQAIHAAGLSA